MRGDVHANQFAGVSRAHSKLLPEPGTAWNVNVALVWFVDASGPESITVSGAAACAAGARHSTITTAATAQRMPSVQREIASITRR